MEIGTVCLNHLISSHIQDSCKRSHEVMSSSKPVHDLGCGIKAKEGEGNLTPDVCSPVHFQIHAKQLFDRSHHFLANYCYLLTVISAPGLEFQRIFQRARIDYQKLSMVQRLFSVCSLWFSLVSHSFSTQSQVELFCTSSSMLSVSQIDTFLNASLHTSILPRPLHDLR